MVLSASLFSESAARAWGFTYWRRSTHARLLLQSAGGGSGEFRPVAVQRQEHGSAILCVQNLGPAVNSASDDSEPAVSPQWAHAALRLHPRWRLRRPGPVGLNPAEHAPFGAPVNLGSAVSTAGYDGCPALSSDGSTLFFMSSRPAVKASWTSTRRRSRAVRLIPQAAFLYIRARTAPGVGGADAGRPPCIQVQQRRKKGC